MKNIIGILLFLISSLMYGIEPSVSIDTHSGIAKFSGHSFERRIDLVDAFGGRISSNSLMGYTYEPDAPGQVRFYVWRGTNLRGDSKRVLLECWSFYIYDTAQGDDHVYGAKVMSGEFRGEVTQAGKGSGLVVALRNIPGLGDFGCKHTFKIKKLMME